jgi:O-antigen/teichoic acid export membrane protein
LQVLARILFGFFAGCFLIVGVAHRGGNWNNALAATSLLVTAGSAALHLTFCFISALQLFLIAVFTLAAYIDLRNLAPSVIPRLRNFQTSKIQAILRPSGYFGMLYSCNFFVYQFPVLVMNRLLGPANVVVFSLTRTIYSMSRQLLTAGSQAIGPEIVQLYGKRDWDQLHRLYDITERGLFALTPVVSMGTFALTPFLIGFWLHKPELYSVHLCFYMALISAVMGAKEHKSVFQTSANEHSAMAKFVFLTYAVMAALSVAVIHMFSLNGYLLLWLLTEIAQLIYIVRLNQRFFAGAVCLNLRYVYRLIGLLSALSVTCFVIGQYFPKWSDVRPISLTFAALLTSASAAYYLFGIKELHSSLSSHFFRRA